MNNSVGYGILGRIVLGRLELAEDGIMGGSICIAWRQCLRRSGTSFLRTCVRASTTLQVRPDSNLPCQVDESKIGKADEDLEQLEQYGLDAVTQLIRNSKLPSSESVISIHEQEEDDPIKIFQNCWNYKKTDDCSDEIGDSFSSTVNGWVDSGDLSRKRRMSEDILLRELAASILRKGWNSDSQRELLAKLQELRPFHVCQILKTVQEPDLSLRIFDWARQQQGYKHTTRSYNALAGILAGSKWIGAWNRIEVEMVKDGCPPDKVTLSTLIRGYSKAHQPDKVLELYKQMRQLQWEPGVVTYSCIIDVLAKHGYTDKAREVYFDMRMNGHHLDKTGYNILINLFGRRRDLHMATKLFKEMSECGLIPDGYTYTALIQTYLKIGDVATAHCLFNEMIDKKLSVSLSTCNSLIYYLGKTGKVDLAFRVFDVIDKLGLQRDILTYKTFVNVLGKMGRVDDVHKLLKDMELRGVSEIGLAYTKAVEWLSEVGCLDAACQLLLDFTKNQGTTIPANATFVDNLIKVGAVDQAHKFFVGMAAMGYATEINMIRSSIKMLSEAGSIDGAFKIFYAMKDLGCPPDHDAYSSIIHCLSKAGSVQALHIFEDMMNSGLTPHVHVYNDLISLFCKNRNMKAALDMFNKMSCQGCAPNEAIYSQLLAGFASMGDWAMVFKLSKDMEDSGLTANCDTYMPLVLSLGNEGRIDHAVLLCNQMLDRGLKPSWQACHELLGMFTRIGAKDKMYTILKKLKAMLEFPDYDSYTLADATSGKLK